MQNQPSSALEGFTQMYAGNPPWEVGRPKAPFVAVADQVTSPVLDAGCGTGDTSLFFAALGHQVTGIDFVEEAIRRGRTKASERGLSVEFLVKDAMTLGDWDQRFASVIDSGLFHVYSGDERRRYVRGLAHVLQPGGRLFLYAFSDQETAVPGGRGVAAGSVRHLRRRLGDRICGVCGGERKAGGRDRVFGGVRLEDAVRGHPKKGVKRPRRERATNEAWTRRSANTVTSTR